MEPFIFHVKYKGVGKVSLIFTPENMLTREGWWLKKLENISTYVIYEWSLTE